MRIEEIFDNDLAERRVRAILNPPQPPPAPALPADWHDEWEERAAIMEFDGGLPRAEAESSAMIDVRKQMRLAGEASGRDEARILSATREKPSDRPCGRP